MNTTLPEKKDRKIALVIVDVQRKFTGRSIPEKGNKDEIDTINKAAEMFRNNNRPVIFVYYDGPGQCSVYDKDDGDEYLHGIISDPKDIIVHKDKMNSFLGTKLAEVVKECGCDSILLAGMVTQYCIMGTYFGAFDHGLSPYLLIGGTISTDPKFDEAAYTICKTFALDDVEDNIRAVKMTGPTKVYGSEHQICSKSDN